MPETTQLVSMSTNSLVTTEWFVMAIVGWLLLEYFAFMCKCEALNDTQLFLIIHQWSGFSLGRRPITMTVCMVSAVLEVVTAHR